jgi:hypothetical protein
MKKLILGLLLVVCLLSFACGPAAPAEEELMAMVEEEEEERAWVPAPEIIIEYPPGVPPGPAPVLTVEVPPLAPPIEEAALGETWATERMIVRTAEIVIVVNDVAIALDRVADLAEDLGGYVVSSTSWKEQERLFGVISIRVPAEDFNSAMDALRGLAVDVTHEDTSAKDVTEEYVDLSAKLKNLEATEESYLRLMEKAEEVEDMLAIQRELSKTRGEIEQTKGRMQYLEQTSATSLIRVQISQAELDINFTASKKRVKVGEEVMFGGQIAGGFGPYSYEWDFGDGETSTSESPVHAYKSGGSYTVSLKLTDDRGNTDTRIREDYIIVSPGWSAGNIARSAWNGLVTFGHGLANMFIWLGILSPIWIVIGGIIFWRFRQRKKRRE